jgi:hypothetical protein
MNDFPKPILPPEDEVLKKLSTKKARKRKYKNAIKVLTSKYAREHMRKLFKNRIIPNGSIDVVID